MDYRNRIQAFFEARYGNDAKPRQSPRPSLTALPCETVPELSQQFFANLHNASTPANLAKSHANEFNLELCSPGKSLDETLELIICDAGLLKGTPYKSLKGLRNNAASEGLDQTFIQNALHFVNDSVNNSVADRYLITRLVLTLDNSMFTANFVRKEAELRSQIEALKKTT